MPRKSKKAPAPNATQVEKLFSTVDETGHADEKKARTEHRHRRKTGQAVDIDPLSDKDPSGSNVENVIRKTAIWFVVIILAVVVVAQVSCGIARRARTADLSSNVNVRTVTAALKGGVEWGNGFTQFPEDFTVDEADEGTGRVEVSVIDTSSKDALECLSGSQIQATAFAINALLNPNINTVVYHVSVHEDDQGKFLQSSMFGFVKPAGTVKGFMTFTWKKNQSATSNGYDWTCTISGVDAETAAKIKASVSPTANTTTLITTTDADTTDETGGDAVSTSAASSDAAASGDAAGAEATGTTTAS